MFSRISLSRIFSVLLVPLFMLTLIGSAQAAETPASINTQPADMPSLFQAVDPTPLYSITWTATGKSSSDVTDSYGQRTVTNRKVSMSGSAIWRKYAAGGFDTVPFNWTVTDDNDEVVTTPCVGQGGSDRDHTTWTITDPSRYSGGPNMGIIINAPLQRPDGSWYMSDPLISLYNEGLYSYRTDSDHIPCGGDPSSDTFTMEMGSYVDLNHPGTLEGDAQGKVFTKTTQFVSPYSDPPLTVQWNITVRVLESSDLTVDALEVTQGIQNEANSISLIQGRRIVVRAYLGVGRDQVPVPSVTGKLSGYAGATLLGSIPPFNPGGRITAPVVPNWKQIEHTLNFELPYAWTLQPNLRLEVEVNPDHSVTEANYNNNKLSSAPLPLLPCGAVSVTYLPIHYTPPGGFAPADPSANIAVGAEFMRKIYPIPDRGLIYYPRNELIEIFNINDPGKASSLVRGLKSMLLSSSASHAEYIFGWLPSLAFNGNGLGQVNGTAAFGNDTESPDRWRRTFAHEVGHNYGFRHPATTTAGAHWFDVYDRVIKPVPASVGGEDLLDFMVPARLEPEAWISPINYEYLVYQICSQAVATAAATSIKSPATVDTLLVTGIINNATPASGSLDPLYHFTTVPTYNLPDGPQYCVNLKNAANTLLNQYCFDQDFSGDSGTPVDAASFGMVVPYPVGLNRVELKKGTTILSSRVASTNPPNVTVTFPNAAGLTLSGMQDVTWTGTDPDGDTLTYNILYSRDNGVTWMGIGSGITGSAYNLDFSGLPGTTGASGRIKVMVSDGFYSTEDISDNPFTIGNKPPDAAIISPSSGATFTAGPKIVLEGAGVDLEDQSLGDSALSWMSNIDGALGAGQLLEVSLSPGVHTITLTAADSDGLTNSASIQITIIKPATFAPATFADVPFSYWASTFIERLYSAGITGGCSLTPLNYCPDSTVTRAQMAVFLLKGIHGSSYTAPAIGTTTGFTDVPVGYWAAAWIKQLAAEGITGGCGTGIYCPDATVTRAQMAIFLLKAEHGSSYLPSAAIGTFTDVPVIYWAASWIERLAVEGITSGCGAGTYCPDAGVTRAQMAVFLVKTFNLP